MDINYDTLADIHATYSAAFQRALEAPSTNEWSQIATRTQSGSAKNVYKFLGTIPKMREWIGQRQLQQVASSGYELANRKFELSFSVSADELADDAGGVVSLYASLMPTYAASVNQLPDELIMGEVLPGGTSTLCFDGQNFFDTDHPVGAATQSNMMGGSGTAWYVLDVSKPLKPFIFQDRLAPQFAAMTDLSNPHVFQNDAFVWGVKRRCAGGYGMWQTAVHSAQTFSAVNLKAALDRMASFTDDDGRKLGCRGNLIVAPQSLEWTIKETLDVQQNSATNNILYKYCPVLISAHL